MWRKGNPSALLVGMQTGSATVETVWNFRRKLKMELPMHFNVHSSTICNSQGLEAA